MISIFTTITDPVRRQDPAKEAITNYLDLADEVVVVNGGSESVGIKSDKLKVINYKWSEEFKFGFIGEQFNRGYEACNGDWVMRCDIDYFIDEDEFKAAKEYLRDTEEPTLAAVKKQFLLVDRYHAKSSIPVFFNKKKYGNRIKLNSGGDLCQPSLDGNEIKYSKGIMEIWNYDFCFKEENIIKKDIGRFARAWEKEFDNRKLGGPDDESAFAKFIEMQVGRFNSRKWQKVNKHIKYIQEKVNNITDKQFGYSMFGRVK